MCAFVIFVIILILGLLIPASYMMGFVRGVASQRVNIKEGMTCCKAKTPDSATLNVYRCNDE